MTLICPYCNSPAVAVTGERIYPHRKDLHNKRFYLCAPCDAYVGCHPNSTTPLGRLANSTLRAKKSEAHRAFDPLWKSGRMSRSTAYSWLSATLNISPDYCHIGMFDETTCKRVVEECHAKNQG